MSGKEYRYNQLSEIHPYISHSSPLIHFNSLYQHSINDHMARNSYFQFKQFRVEQGLCAMKITTDACLLGALTEVENSKRILDIGAGTGLLSLMIAQRSIAMVDAVELDEQAAQQAKDNFSNSLWTERLKLFKNSIQDFKGSLEGNSAEGGYDTIICNPPFFHNGYKAPDHQRSMARHTDSLSFEDLSEAIGRLLSNNGKAWVILPVESSTLFMERVRSQNTLFLKKSISLRSSELHEIHRNILVLGKTEEKSDDELVTIYNKHPDYTEQSRELLEPYYLFL